MGYPVRAVEDGEVFQIKHFAGADGKVLYIRHKNSRITVYAHLFEFMPEIETLVRKERRQGKKYGFRIWLEKPIRIKKGSIIGYSGKSGTLSPHLHFEIRSSDNQPINPFKNGFPVADISPPILKGIVLEPADPSSAVEGGFAGRRFDFVQRDGEYILAKNPWVAGRVRITLEACDQTTAGSCNGVYRIEAYSKSSRCSFIVSFEKFSFRDNFKGLSIYQKESNFFKGRYLYRLFSIPSACTPFLDTKPYPSWPGWLEAGEYLTIKVYDASDNYAIGKILLKEDPGYYNFSDRVVKYPFLIKEGEKKAVSIDNGSFKLEFNPDSLCSRDYLSIQKKRKRGGQFIR